MKNNYPPTPDWRKTTCHKGILHSHKQSQTKLFNTLNQTNISKISQTRNSKFMAPFLGCCLLEDLFVPLNKTTFSWCLKTPNSQALSSSDQVAATKPNSVQWWGPPMPHKVMQGTPFLNFNKIKIMDLGMMVFQAHLCIYLYIYIYTNEEIEEWRERERERESFCVKTKNEFFFFNFGGQL